MVADDVRATQRALLLSSALSSEPRKAYCVESCWHTKESVISAAMLDGATRALRQGPEVAARIDALSAFVIAEGI